MAFTLKKPGQRKEEEKKTAWGKEFSHNREQAGKIINREVNKVETTKTIIVILGVFFLINFIACKKEEMEIPQANLGRSINLGNALEAPQEGEWGIVIQEYFFDKIKNVGFKAVRIPIRWSAHTETHFPYTINESFFQRVDDVINQALAREAEKRDISWAYWEFGAGFGIYDIENDEWDMGLLNALIPHVLVFDKDASPQSQSH